MGELVFGNLVAGKKAQVGGSVEMPHSWAYIEDVGRAAAILDFVLDVQRQQTGLTQFLVASCVTDATRQIAYAQAARPLPPRSGPVVRRD